MLIRLPQILGESGYPRLLGILPDLGHSSLTHVCSANIWDIK